MTAPRPAQRLRSVLDVLRDAGFIIAAVKVAADGAIEVQTKDDPRVAAPPRNSWDDA